MPSPTVVAPNDLEPLGEPDPGVSRAVAFDVGDVSILRNRIPAGEFSGWHSHGDNGVYAYVLAGAVRVVYGPDERQVEARAGEFLLIPSGVVHRNGNPADVETELVVGYVGEGDLVVPADGPPESVPDDPPRVATEADCVPASSLQNLTRLTPFPDAPVQQVKGHADGRVESEWHHHGDNDVFGYVIRGEGYVEWEGGRELASAGSFFHVPAGLVHRDVNPDDEEQDYVLWLDGTEPRTVPAENPQD